VKNGLLPYCVFDTYDQYILLKKIVTVILYCVFDTHHQYILFKTLVTVIYQTK